MTIEATNGWAGLKAGLAMILEADGSPACIRTMVTPTGSRTDMKSPGSWK